MPNHVYSTLKLSGDQQEIQNLINAVSKTEEDGSIAYDFDCLLPCPEELLKYQSPSRIVSDEEYKVFAEKYDKNLPMTEEIQADLISKYEADNWYDWYMKNWGTKWGLYDISIDCDGLVYYKTAWGPANIFFEKISKKYPNIIFITKYVDEGLFFVGESIFENGNEIINRYDIKSVKAKEIMKEVGYNIDDDYD